MSNLVGIATWNFGDGTLAERIDRFAAMGYNAMSLIFSDARAMAKGEAPDVEEALARNSLPVTLHGGLAPTREPLQADALLADFELFTAWQAKTGRLLSVNYDAAKLKTDSGLEYQTQEMHDVLARMLDVSDGAGFSVGVEDWPLNGEQYAAVEDLTRYSHFGMLVDLGHLNMRLERGDGSDSTFPVDTAQRHLDRMPLRFNELHIHNNDGKHDLHAPPTVGTSDLVALAQILKSKGVDCISTIELVPAWCGLTETQGWKAAQEALAFWRDAFVCPVS